MDFNLISHKKYAIIMVVYNSKINIKESINSIINQSLDFEKNIQLILVDDGSSDGSNDILLEYKKHYPNNIIIVKQRHLGTSVAWNNAFKYIDADFISFMGDEDCIDEDTLKEVDLFLDEHDDINIIKVPIKYLENNYFVEFEPNYPSSKIINLMETEDIILHACSLFIRTSLIKDIDMDSMVYSKEEIFFINKILIDNPKIAILNNGVYFKRNKDNNLNYSKNTDYLKLFKNYFLNLLKYTKKHDTTPLFIQYLIVYDLSFLLRKKEYDLNLEKTKFNDLIKEVLSYVDDEVINNNKFFGNLPIVKNIFFYYKYGDLSVKFLSNNVKLFIGNIAIDTLNVHNLYIDSFKVKNENIIVKGFLNSYFDSKNISIKAVVFYNDKSTEYIAKNLKSNEHIKFLSKIWQFNHLFELEIPFNEGIEINFKVIYHINSNQNDFSENNIIEIDLPLENSNISFPVLYHKKNNTLICTDKILFSIVIAVYNAEKYLDKTINSIINQSIGFNQIQLILVNDGSTDSSQEIINSYKQFYPDNIVSLEQENSGQASARNLGLEYVKGEFVNFLDSDDYLSENTLESVYDFFNKHWGEMDVVAIPILMFGRINQEHILNKKFNKSRVVDLNNEPNCIQLSASSTFVLKKAINCRFPVNMIGSEDAHFINKIIIQQMKLGIITDCYYYYRRRENYSSTLDIMDTKKEFYLDRLKNHFLELIHYCLSTLDEVPPYIQYVLAYDLQWILLKDKIEILSNEELKIFFKYLYEIITYIDIESFVNNIFISNGLVKSYFKYLKNGSEKNIFNNNKTVLLKSNNVVLDNLDIHQLYLDIIEVRDGFINISGFLNSLFNSDNIIIEGVKISNSSENVYKGNYVKYPTRKNVEFLYETWQYKYNFDIKIPFDESTFKVKIRVKYVDRDEVLYSGFLKINFNKHARLSEDSYYSIKDSKILCYQKNQFIISDYSYVKIIKYEYNILKNILKSKRNDYLNVLMLRILYLIFYPILNLFNKSIYLFMDRMDKADDNAEQLFSYASTKKDNIKKYFVLTKESTDWNRVSKKGKMLEYKSFKHQLFYLLAEKIITSHPDESVINPFFSKNSKKDLRSSVNGLINLNIYFLQHGVTKDNIAYYLRKYDKNLSLILTVSDKEKDSFLDGSYNFDEKIIQTLGFPRYDLLNSISTKKEILFIPTWRDYLEGNENIFINSEYFKRINKVLTDDELIKFLKDNGYKLIFKGHPRLENKINDKTNKRYIDLFEVNKNIRLSTDESYHELFNTASLLITDFSSVSFDFAYLKKPIIYYHYSNDYHHDPGIFDYILDGFGDEIQTHEGLVNKIKYYVKNNMEMETVYKKRVNDFYKFNDNNNSKRVYEWIKKH